MIASAPRWTYRTSLVLLAVAAGISILWAIALERGEGVGVMGFPGIYFGTKCLERGADPYNAQQLQRVYDEAGLGNPSASAAVRQSVTLYVNLPSTFLLVAPFTLLPLGAAKALWLTILIGSFSLAAFLMWQVAHAYSHAVALLLTFIVLANCEILFSGGNTAGLVVSLCVIAVWCFVNDCYVGAGMVCMAVSLAIKPHDAGLVWLYFLLSGQTQRRRAVRACILSLALVVLATLWISHVAPHWLPELRSNLAAISGTGGINEPGPTSIGVNSPDMIIDLQTVVSVFVDDPAIYNPLTYAVCSLIFLFWLLAVLRSSKPTRNAWFALASVTSLSMLITYHRSYDARLLLLSIPASAILWADGGIIAWSAVLLTLASIVFTADIPLAILMHATRNLSGSSTDFAHTVLIALVTRPAPLILLAMAIFYLLVYIRREKGLNVHQHASAFRMEA